MSESYIVFMSVNLKLNKLIPGGQGNSMLCFDVGLPKNGTVHVNVHKRPWSDEPACL